MKRVRKTLKRRMRACVTEAGGEWKTAHKLIKMYMKTRNRGIDLPDQMCVPSIYVAHGLLEKNN